MVGGFVSATNGICSVVEVFGARGPRPSVACATHATEGRDAVALRKALQQHVPCSRCLPAAVHNAQIACRYHGAECFGCVPFQAMMMIAFITLLKK